MSTKVGGSHDPKAAAHLARIVATATAPAGSDPAHGNAQVNQQNQGNQQASTGGPNNPDTTGNTGGGGGGSGDGWGKFKLVMGILIALIGAVGLFVWSLRSNPDKIPDSEVAQSHAKIAKATGMAPPGWVPGVKAKPAVEGPQVVERREVEVQSHQTSNYVVEGKTFSCPPLGTDEEVIKSAYRNSTLHYLGSGQALRISSTDPNNSCILVKVDTVVTRLDGDGYFMGIPHENDKWWKCGTYGGQNDSLETCRKWLNAFSGKEIYVGVRYGGRLNIN